MTTNYTALALADAVLGWQNPQNDRGTWDIIWTSLQTLALCAWVSVCTNAAAPQQGDWDILRDKFYFVLLTLAGPELVLLLAFGQWQTARASVSEYHEAGYKDWTIVHSFYADMGGIHVTSSDFPSFPVNAKQLLYLLKKDYIDLPSLSESDIDGLGKSDNLAKCIALAQALSFLINTIARIAQGLAVTTLEMTVIANIFCTLAAYICWWNKPSDVKVIHFYHLKSKMSDIVKEAGDHPNGEYRDTPLDFVSRNEWAASLTWRYFVNILYRLRLLRKLKIQQPPVQRFTTFNFPRPRNKPWLVFLLFMALAYTSFFLAAWNFYFPSVVEQQLWRVVVATQSATSFIGAVEGIVMFDQPVEHKKPERAVDIPDTQLRVQTASTKLHKARDFWNMPCNNELTGNFPFLDVPLRRVLIMTPLGAVYTVCRAIILTEDIVSLRLLPASAFETVSWSRFLPWF